MNELLKFMKTQGYFKTIIEFEKALKYLETGIIPDWFKKDLEKYNFELKERKV